MKTPGKAEPSRCRLKRVTLLALVLSTPARAGTLYTTDLEALALGQGGATVAAPTTMAAVWYNPAGLAWQRGLRLELEYGIITSPLTFDRAPIEPGSAYDRVENQRPWTQAGLAGASYDFGRDDLTAGLLAFAPSSNHYEYDPLGAQRFQGVDGKYTLIFLHAAFAYRLPGNVALGVALGPTFFSARQDNVISVAPLGDPEGDLFAVPITFKASKPPFLTGSLGVSWRPWPALALGASVMPRFDVRASGTVEMRLPPLVKSVAKVSGDGLALTLRFPTIARLGARWWPHRRVAVELAGVFEGWSRYSAVDLEPMIEVDAPALGIDHLVVPALKLEKRYHDVVSVRLGGDVRVLPRLSLRAGAYFESSGENKAYFDVTAPDAAKVGVTLGATVRLTRALQLDLAYAHTFVPDVEVSESKTTVLNPIYPENSKVIGDGVYRFSFDFFHLGLRLELFGED